MGAIRIDGSPLSRLPRPSSSLGLPTSEPGPGTPAPVILYRTYRTSTVLVPTAACFTVTYVLVLPRYSRPLSWG